MLQFFGKDEASTAGGDEREEPSASGWNFGDLHSSYLAWVILFASAVISAVAWYISHTSVMNMAETRFKFMAEDVQLAIQRRMQEHEATLWSGIGLFNASNKVTRTEFHEYVKALNLETYLPGLQGMGYAEFVRTGGEQAHIARVRSEGFPEFSIRPPGKREAYSSIIYLEPFSGRNLRAFGYDMFSEPTRRAAMMRAGDTGEAAISGMVTLVQETKSDVQRGFLMYLPNYKKGMPLDTIEQRQKALQGFVYSPFRMNDLMKGILGRGDQEIQFSVFDGSQVISAAQMYDSQSQDSELAQSRYQPAFTAQKVIQVAGREWTLQFASKPNFISASEENQPLLVAAGAIVIDILLFLTISSLTSQRARSTRLARQMTSELRRAKEAAERATENEIVLRRATQETNQKLKEANEGLLKFSSIVAHDLRAPLKRVETFVDILREDYADKLDYEGIDILCRIERGSTRMRMMLDSLHSYSKCAGVSIEDKSASVEVIVNEAIETLEGVTGKAKITTDLEGGLSVAGDRILLGHVIQNLISNSLKFCDKPIAKIEIRSEKLGENQVMISVSDNGIGIEPEHAGGVFNMFERLHDEDEYEGTGIGLAICKKIVTDHYGEIAVDTSYKDGARILFTLPYVSVQEDVRKVNEAA